MDALRRALDAIVAAEPWRVVLSAPRAGGLYRRATATRLEQGWQVETLTATQAFHRNIGPQELPGTLLELLEQHFTQLTAHANGREHRLRITKKGGVLTGQSAAPQAAPPQSPTHNRQKRQLVPEGTVIPALVDMGVLTADGQVVAAKRDKFRQINRFVELVEDGLRARPAQKLNIVEFGCGKSALSFVLYHYLTQVRKIDVTMLGLDLREDVVAACTGAAARYGYTGLQFQVGDIADYDTETPVDMVVTLHACDTATDLALAKAAAWGAGLIFSVPCCQHELNEQIHSDALALLTRYGLVQERVSALMTDAIRANLLAACGYKTQLVEFVGFEHTPKNIMIRAVRTGLPAPQRQRALAEVERLCAAFRLEPCLLGLLRAAGALPE